MHQNLAVILQLFNYGKNSFTGLIRVLLKQSFVSFHQFFLYHLLCYFY